jgi:hypothetical protein
LKKIEKLEDKADLLRSQSRQPTVGKPGNILSIYKDPAFGWPVQTADQMHESALSMAGRADDAREGASRYLQVHSPKGLSFDLSRTVRLD